MTCIFANDLLQSRGEDAPREDLDILLNVPGLGVGEAHDELEELLAVLLGLGDGRRAESLQVATNAVLLFHREAHRHESLEQLDGVDTGDVALSLLRPPDAADTDTIWRALFRTNRLESSGDDTARLTASELHQATLDIPLFRGPVVDHSVEVAVDLEHRLGVCRVNSVRVERLRLSTRGCGRLRDCRCADERWVATASRSREERRPASSNHALDRWRPRSSGERRVVVVRWTLSRLQSGCGRSRLCAVELLLSLNARKRMAVRRLRYRETTGL